MYWFKSMTIIEVQVSAVDPIASMQAIENTDLGDVAKQVQAKLKTVIDKL